MGNLGIAEARWEDGAPVRANDPIPRASTPERDAVGETKKAPAVERSRPRHPFRTNQGTATHFQPDVMNLE